MLTLRDMERVCDRLDERLSDPHIDDEGVVDVATALMLLTNRLEHVVQEYRSQQGTRRDLQMAALALEAAGGCFRRFGDQAKIASMNEAGTQLTVAQQNVALALGLMRGSDDAASVA